MNWWYAGPIVLSMGDRNSIYVYKIYIHIYIHIYIYISASHEASGVDLPREPIKLCAVGSRRSWVQLFGALLVVQTFQR